MSIFPPFSGSREEKVYHLFFRKESLEISFSTIRMPERISFLSGDGFLNLALWQTPFPPKSQKQVWEAPYPSENSEVRLPPHLG